MIEIGQLVEIDSCECRDQLLCVGLTDQLRSHFTTGLDQHLALE